MSDARTSEARTRADLEAMTVDDLRDLARERDVSIPAGSRKAEIVNRLDASEAPRRMAGAGEEGIVEAGSHERVVSAAPAAAGAALVELRLRWRTVEGRPGDVIRVRQQRADELRGLGIVDEVE